RVGPGRRPTQVSIRRARRHRPAPRPRQVRPIAPVQPTLREARRFTFERKPPPPAVLARQAAGVEKASERPGREQVATVTRAQVRQIAQTKMADLNTTDVDAAMKVVEGTARSMGIKVS